MIQIPFCVYLYKTLYVQKNLLYEYMLLGALEFDGFYLDLSMKLNFYLLEFQNWICCRNCKLNYSIWTLRNLIHAIACCSEFNQF